MKRRLNVRYGSGSAIPTNESGRSVSKAEPTTGLESTADAVNRKAGVALGRSRDGRGVSHELPLLAELRLHS